MASVLAFFALGLVVFLAYFLRSLSGFSSTLAAMPLLVLLFEDVKFAVAVLAVVELVYAISSYRSLPPGPSLMHYAPALAPILFGVVLGALLLRLTPASALRIAFGALAVFYALKIFLGEGMRVRALKVPDWVYMLSGGFLTGLFNAGKPPLLHGVRERHVIESPRPVASVVLAASALQVAVYALSGIIYSTTLVHSIIALPFMYLTVLLGRVTPPSLDGRLVSGIMSAVLLVSGAFILLM